METMSSENLVADIKNMQIYQSDVHVLKDINLEVKRRDFIYIIGRTGSGKSSFLKTLYGDLELRGADKAMVAGYDIKTIKEKEIPFLRRKVGIVFQDFQLLTDRNIEDNLRFVLEATGWKDKVLMQSKIEDILQLVNLKDKNKKMPYQLSGGEQQRVVVARALLNDPKIILADEPTGNLDPRTTDDIMRLLFNINRELGTPVLMATHNYQLIDKFPGTVYICAKHKLIRSVEVEDDDEDDEA